LRVAFREFELFDTGDVAGADEVFAPDLIDHHNASPDAASDIDSMRALIVRRVTDSAAPNTESCSTASFPTAG